MSLHLAVPLDVVFLMGIAEFCALMLSFFGLGAEFVL